MTALTPLAPRLPTSYDACVAEQLIGARVRQRTVSTDITAPLAVTAVALLARIVALVLGRGSAIDMDGTEYVRVAQNIAAGHGPIGMRGIPMLVFPPLYSWLIAALIRLGVEPQTAATAIVVVAGVAFAVLLYVLGATLYGRRAGLYAGLIGALLPACVTLSTTAVSESLYGALSLAGLLALVRFVRRPSLGDAAWCGAAFGVSSMVRPEGVLFALVAFIAVLAVTLAARRSIAFPALLAACAIAGALPAVVATYAITGHVIVEGKTAINFQLGKRLRAGTPYIAVADKVDEAGNPVGPEIDPRYYIWQDHPPALDRQERLALIAGAAVRHVRDVGGAFKSSEYGRGALVVLGLIGLIFAARSRARLGNEVVLLVYLATAYIALASVWHFWPRYAAAFLPPAIVWAALGLTVLGRWSGLKRLPDAGVAVLAVFLLFCCAIDVKMARANGGPAIESQAGDWIAAHGLPASVVDVSTMAAFYGGATWSPLPYGDEVAATRYLTRLRPTYIVIDTSREADYAPLAQWFEHGVPPSLATRVDTVSDGGRSLVIYRFGKTR